MRREHEHLLAEIERFLHAMGHEEDRRLRVPPDAEELFVQPVAGDLIERAKGLVHEQDLWRCDERARDRNALPHAARKLVRKGVVPVREADEREHCFRRAPTLGETRPVADFEGELDILPSRPPRKKRCILENETEVAPSSHFRRRRAENRDAPFGGCDQIRGNTKKRRLAAARRSENGEKTAARDLEAHVLERVHGAAIGVEANRNIRDGNGVGHGA